MTRTIPSHAKDLQSGKWQRLTASEQADARRVRCLYGALRAAAMLGVSVPALETGESGGVLRKDACERLRAGLARAGVQP